MHEAGLHARMHAWGSPLPHLEVQQQVRAGHGAPREEVLGHPIVLALHLFGIHGQRIITGFFKSLNI
jgi:hypothetical protein